MHGPAVGRSKPFMRSGRPETEEPPDPSTQETAITILRSLVDGDWLNEDHCHFCGEENYDFEPNNHTSTCPYKTAKAFLASL